MEVGASGGRCGRRAQECAGVRCDAGRAQVSADAIRCKSAWRAMRPSIGRIVRSRAKAFWQEMQGHCARAWRRGLRTPGLRRETGGGRMTRRSLPELGIRFAAQAVTSYTPAPSCNRPPSARVLRSPRAPRWQQVRARAHQRCGESDCIERPDIPEPGGHHLPLAHLRPSGQLRAA